MKKNQWFNYVYWSIAGLVIWTIIFVLAFFNAKKALNDCLGISSAILLAISFLTLLLKWGWMEKTIVRYRNSKFNLTSEKVKDKKIDLNTYHQVLKKRKLWLILLNVVIYAILFIVSFFV